MDPHLVQQQMQGLQGGSGQSPGSQPGPSGHWTPGGGMTPTMSAPGAGAPNMNMNMNMNMGMGMGMGMPPPPGLPMPGPNGPWQGMPLPGTQAGFPGNMPALLQAAFAQGAASAAMRRPIGAAEDDDAFVRAVREAPGRSLKQVLEGLHMVRLSQCAGVCAVLTSGVCSCRKMAIRRWRGRCAGLHLVH
jgi:hypothetical protein